MRGRDAVLMACWSAKGGAGTTVVAAAAAVLRSRTSGHGALLVDLAGDAPAALGLAYHPGLGVHSWLAASGPVAIDGLARLELRVDDRLSILPAGVGRCGVLGRVDDLLAQLRADGRDVVVDCGTIADRDDVAGAVASRVEPSLLVTRCCYLAMRRSVHLGLTPTGVVVVNEPGRALRGNDVAEVVCAPIVAEVATDPQVSRVVDAGLLATRLTRSLERSLAGLVRS